MHWVLLVLTLSQVVVKSSRSKTPPAVRKVCGPIRAVMGVALFLKSLLFIPIAVIVFRHANSEAAPFLQPYLESCPKIVSEKAPFNIPGVDQVFAASNFFLCLLTPFFKALLARHEGVLIWIVFMIVGQPFTAFLAVESSRAGARFPLTWVPLFMFLFQFVGVSLILPAVWVPAYFLVGQFGKSPAAAEKWKISSARVVAIGFILAALWGTSIAICFPWSEKRLDFFIAIMLFSPVVAPFFWLLVPVTKFSVQRNGHEAVIVLHLLLGGVSMAAQIFSVIYCIHYPSTLQDLWGLISVHEGELGAFYFLLVDLVLFWSALVFTILVEEGLKVAMYVIGGSFVFGPGTALALYYAHREKCILSRITSSEKKKNA